MSKASFRNPDDRENIDAGRTTNGAWISFGYATGWRRLILKKHDALALAIALIVAIQPAKKVT